MGLAGVAMSSLSRPGNGHPLRIDHLIFVVPGLLQAAPDMTSERIRASSEVHSFSSESAPYLARLLAAAGAPQMDADGVDGALARLYGLTRQDDWPLAPVFVNALE